MNSRKVAARALRLVGMLLIMLGVVHLAATPHMPVLLNAMKSADSYRLALSATILNHVLVGFLLLPLGYTTWLASSETFFTEAWARKTLRVNAAAILTLPISALVLMREPEYYSAPLFLAGVALASVAGLIVLAATVLATRPKG